MEKMMLKKIQIVSFVIFFTGSISSQEIFSPNQNITPFSSPEDCRMIQWNAAVISKRVIEIYEKIDEEVTSGTSTASKSVDIQLDRAKKLSDISLSLSKTYEAFCNKK